MKQKIGRYEYTIDAYLTDFRGKATLPMIGGYMLQVATKHAEERSFGYSYMTENKRVWVLSRMAIEMFEYPANDTIFVVKTWVASVNRLFTERFFAFEDQNGKPLGYAKSLWAAIDMETRRPTNVLDLKNMTDYIETEQSCPIKDMGKISALKDNAEEVGSFVVKYSDIDINKHLNSMKYIEHFVDIFDIEMFVNKEIERFEINYLSEGHYGKQINILQFLEADNQYILEMKVGDNIVSTTRIIWR